MTPRPPERAKAARERRARPRSAPPRRKARSTPAPPSLRPALTDSEVEAYIFIRNHLKDFGWVVKNPSRFPDGQVWIQNQCLSHPGIKAALGNTRPENIVKLSETKVWIIEAKRDRALLANALKEAENDYARPINEGGLLTVPLITGVAGNDNTGFEVRTRLLVDGSYVPVTINGREATGLLGPEIVDRLLMTGNPAIADVPVNETMFLKAAEQINRTLHIGGINKNDRARVMAALLLALLEEPGPQVESDLLVLIDDINTRTKAILRKHGKAEFHPFVVITPPTNSDNHVKFRTAIIQTIQELNNLSIKSAMNSGTDVLGKFYEVFLKYGNGAKEIGIVLTPRHITKFSVEALGVGPNDIVLDPACGTGGFLVAALDHVRKGTGPAQLDRFKRYNIFGIERESYVAALAIVNMIFRGDGKNNIIEANCFSKRLKRATIDGNASAKYVSTKPTAGEEPISRVFMNPPFALKESDEKEYRFVEAALESMAEGGLLFAIVPMSVMVEHGKDGAWRRNSLLPHHTLVGVLSFPEELFYPIANQTVGVIIRKGVPHPGDQPVLWIRIVNDGFQKSKGKRLPLPGSPTTDLDRARPIVSAFALDPKTEVASVPEFVRVCPIDLNDPVLELVPEAYVESRIPEEAGLMARLDRQVRENIASLVEVDLKYGAPGSPTIIDTARGHANPSAPETLGAWPEFKRFELDSLFELTPGDYHSLGELEAGLIAVASCADFGNGIVGTYAPPPSAVYRDALTIAFNGRPLTTKLHPYRFAAKDDVAVAIPKISLSPEALVFIQAALNAERWRFSYYRKAFKNKLGRMTVTLPVNDEGTLNEAFMAKAVRNQPHWWFLAPRLEYWKPETPSA